MCEKKENIFYVIIWIVIKIITSCQTFPPAGILCLIHLEIIMSFLFSK